jgi:hypothetical protein
MRAKIQLDRISGSILRFCDYNRREKHTERQYCEKHVRSPMNVHVGVPTNTRPSFLGFF